MNPKQEKFVKEYLLDQNATQAAKSAGYSEDTAYSIGQRLLKHVEIKVLIEAGLELQKKELERRAQKYLCTKERWIEELSKIAFADMDDFVKIDEHGIKLIATETREKKLGGVIRKLSESTSQHGGSQAIELHPKMPALEMLGKHFGWLRDAVEHSGNIGTTINREEKLNELFKTDQRTEHTRALIELLCEKKGDEKNGESTHKDLPQGPVSG